MAGGRPDDHEPAEIRAGSERGEPLLGIAMGLGRTAQSSAPTIHAKPSVIGGSGRPASGPPARPTWPNLARRGVASKETGTRPSSRWPLKGTRPTSLPRADRLRFRLVRLAQPAALAAGTTASPGSPSGSARSTSPARGQQRLAHPTWVSSNRPATTPVIPASPPADPLRARPRAQGIRRFAGHLRRGARRFSSAPGCTRHAKLRSDRGRRFEPTSQRDGAPRPWGQFPRIHRRDESWHAAGFRSPLRLFPRVPRTTASPPRDGTAASCCGCTSPRARPCA